MAVILNHLKEKTQDLHDKLEKVSYAREIMSGQLLQDDYIDLLLKNQFLYQQLEARLSVALSAGLAPSLSSFTSERLADVKKDLAYFREQSRVLASAELAKALQPMHSRAELVGLLYVLEGARLGAKVIVKALSNNPNLQHLPAFHFYQQKGIDSRHRWLSFKAAVEELLQNDLPGQDIAASYARKVFSFFHLVHTTKDLYKIL